MIKYLAFLNCCITAVALSAQLKSPEKCFNKNFHDTVSYSKFTNHKVIPPEIKEPVLIALLYYPELLSSNIIFRYRNKITPLSTRPKLIDVFKKKEKRRYIITISIKTNKKIAPILFSNLPYNAQIGVIGHELGHVTDFRSKGFLQLSLLFFKMLNSKSVDRFEYKTDLICINHGLGYQLYDWSKYIRDALCISEWRGSSENYSSKKANLLNQRYMNPQTIMHYIDSNSIYQKIK